MTTTEMTALDLFDPATRVDPYPLYEHLRNTSIGIHRLEPINGWLFMRYDDTQELLKNRDQWSSDFFNTDIGFGVHDPQNPAHRRWAAIASQNLLASDPPKHTRLRTLLSHAFSGRALRAWSPAITESIEEVLAEVPVGAEFNAIAEIADVLPVRVISKLIGIPIADVERFHRLSLALTETFDVAVQGERRDRAILDSLELFEYVRGLAEERRDDPELDSYDDLLSTLLQAEESGGRLNMDELLATIGILLVAGNETTTDTIGNGLGLLTQNPDQMAAVRTDRSLINKAILEILRSESPIQTTGRKTVKTVEYKGVTIKKGENVFVCMGSANRDDRVYDHPEKFDIHRGDSRHLAFGLGAHFCIGNQLARIQVAMLLNELFDRYRLIEAGPSKRIQRSDRLLQRGLADLPVIFHSA